MNCLCGNGDVWGSCKIKEGDDFYTYFDCKKCGTEGKWWGEYYSELRHKLNLWDHVIGSFKKWGLI